MRYLAVHFDFDDELLHRRTGCSEEVSEVHLQADEPNFARVAAKVLAENLPYLFERKPIAWHFLASARPCRSHSGDPGG